MPSGIYIYKPWSIERKMKHSIIAKEKKYGLWMKGKKFFNRIGKPCSEQTKLKMSLSHKNKKYKPMSIKGKYNLSIAHIGQPAWNKGLKGYNPEGVIRWSKGNIPWNNGKKLPNSHPIGMLGKKHTEGWKQKMREQHKGDKCHLWKGSITPLATMIRHSIESKQWKKEVFIRDNFTCQECFVKGEKLNSHHKNKSFSQLLQEFLKQYSQFSPIEDKETLVRLAITYEPFWDINNGITLCKYCHHSNYTRRTLWI